MRHREERFTTPDGIDIYTQTWSAAGMPKAVILIVHGLGEHSGRYQNYVAYFVPRGYTLYGFDTRGHGRSGGSRGYVERFDQYVEDVDQRAAQIRSDMPGVPLFILGHSLGSLIVLSYGLQHPGGLAGIIVSGTALQDALEVPGWKRRMAGVLSRAAPSLKMNNGVPLKYLSHDPDVIAAYEADPLTHEWGTPRLATEAEAVRVMLNRRAGEWRVPLLMLHGGADPVCLPQGARAFYAKVPAGLADYYEYDGLYHEIHNEVEKATVFSDVEAWLQTRL